MKKIPCTIIRGGSSKGIFVERELLPPEGPERDRCMLALFGSPDPRQIDGLGGADKLTSKAAIMGPPTRKDCDIGRPIAAKLSERLGQQVIVDNRGGAGGIIGTETGARADPDGYTLTMTGAAYTLYSPLRDKLPFDPLKSFAPVARLGSGPNVLVVRPSLPVKSVKELIALAKQKPGQLIFVSVGAGASLHMGTELFKIMADIKLEK